MKSHPKQEELFKILRDDRFSLSGDPDQIPEKIRALIHDLVTDLINLGDSQQNIIDQSTQDDHLIGAYFFHYETMNQVKDLLLLIRDIEFQHLKAESLLLDNHLTPDQLDAFCQDSSDYLSQAIIDTKIQHQKKMV
ncbi:MAG: hypothetical protein IPL46_05690 [Saprospiraceae bacterium]|nr:hypothetical protein [Saprospiraceae bacterium]